jgi:hypothetical protein
MYMLSRALTTCGSVMADSSRQQDSHRDVSSLRKHRCAARSRATGAASVASSRRSARPPSGAAASRSQARCRCGGRRDHEVEESGLAHELRAVIGAVGEQMLEARPAIANGFEDHLRAGAVGEVRRGEIDQQPPPVGIHRHIALAPDRLLGGVVAALRTWRRRFDPLAVDDAALELASRPARSRSTISAMSWMVRNFQRFRPLRAGGGTAP